ncbi:MAG: SEC-C domain-containing protein [Chloroflexi bacterium]|nr:SEC-C domain-containing protein [Chloroflexota bacterium]
MVEQWSGLRTLLFLPEIATDSERGAKIGRNAKCPCGSGMKHKRCRGKRVARD